MSEWRSVLPEFQGVDLGDKRLDARCGAVVASLEATPDASFPEAAPDDAALEGVYRFFSNEGVTFSDKKINPARPQPKRRPAGKK